MSYRPFERVPSLCKIILSSLLAVSLTHAGVQRLDLNGNGTSDIGELNYVTADFNPDLDPDEDGVASRSESIASTNPFDSRSVPRITQFQVTTNGVLASMAAALGKRYDLQATEQLCGSLATNWFTVAGTVARTNTVVTLHASSDQPSRFFRMVVSDVDTDGDGLNDWEEYQLGLDPLSANSATNANGKLLGD